MIGGCGDLGLVDCSRHRYGYWDRRGARLFLPHGWVWQPPFILSVSSATLLPRDHLVLAASVRNPGNRRDLCSGAK